MICALCGPTEFPVTMRTFTFTGQVAYLTVCDMCRDRANEALAKAESRGAPRPQLDVDVKPYIVQERIDKKNRQTEPKTKKLPPQFPRAKRKMPGAPDQKHIRVSARYGRS